jgi:hypothetical protein
MKTVKVMLLMAAIALGLAGTAKAAHKGCCLQRNAAPRVLVASKHKYVNRRRGPRGLRLVVSLMAR